LVVAYLFRRSSLPNQILPSEAQAAEPAKGGPSLAVKYPQLGLGMIAIFLYVGVEVSTASNLPEYMRLHADIPTSDAAPYISLFWASLMIGRWTSSAGAFETSYGLKQLLRFLMPYLAFLVFLIANSIAGSDLAVFYPYSAVILVMILAEIISKGHPARQLVIFSFCGIAALVIGMMSSGLTSLYAFISVGLFCSTLWPCIFTLAISGLGKYTNQGSSYLIMMVMGGGLVSWFQGWMAGPEIVGIRLSYIVGVACFVYLAFYGWKSAKVLRVQGITLDEPMSTGH
jgi:MFS transporter, FHS family, L-fucose permease